MSKVQNLRKNEGFEIADSITIKYHVTETLEKTILMFENYIKEETLATELIKDDKVQDEYDLNGEKTYVSISKN